MTFDPRQYEEQVLKPLRQVSTLPDDLIARYAVDPSLDATALEAHLRRVRGLWNQKASARAGNLARACKLLISADQELQKKEGPNLLMPAWWQRQARVQADKNQAAVTRLVGILRDSYGASGTVTQSQLDDLAKFHGLSGAAAAAAAKQAKLDVVEAVAIPESPGLERTAFEELRTKLAEAQAPTIVHLLLPHLRGRFRIVRSFAAASDPAARLDQDALTKQLKDAESKADSTAVRARKAALGLLNTAVKSGNDVRTIALYHLADLVRRSRSQRRLPDPAVVATLVDLDLERDDAILLVASVPQGGGASTVRGADLVQELLQRGRLREAQQILATLPASVPGYAEAKQAAAGTEAELDRLLAAAAAAAGSDQLNEADSLYRRAAQLAGDDQGVTQRWERLPLPAPGDLNAAATENGVRLAWRAIGGSGEQVHYLVRRASTRSPIDASDGDLVAETTNTYAADQAPYPGVATHYSVFASRNERDWSRPAVAQIQVVPPVSRASPEVERSNLIRVSWTAHHEVRHALVTRIPASYGPGVAPAPVRIESERTSFSDTGVDENTEYIYRIVAVYHGRDGTELQAEPVVVRATARGRAVPVTSLAAASVAGSGGTRVRLTWTVENPAAAVRIRRGTQRPSFTQDSSVTVERLESYGEEVDGDVRPDGDQMTMEAAVPPGQYIFVAFSLGAGGDNGRGGARVGPSAVLSQCQPAANLEARRLDHQAVLSWVWPKDAGGARVRWFDGDGKPLGSRVLTKTQYGTENGCRFAVGPGEVIAEVTIIARTPLGEAGSEPVRATLPGRPARLSYRLTRQGGLRGLASKGKRTLTVSADRDCAGLELVLVAASGLVMPRRREQGTEIARMRGLVLRQGSPETFDVDVPSSIRRPYWLKCFVVAPAGTQLTDPPVTEMKVS